YTIGPGVFQRTGTPMFSYSNLEVVDIDGAQAHGTYDITGTAGSVITRLLGAGSGSHFSVENTGASSNVEIFGSTDQDVFDITTTGPGSQLSLIGWFGADSFHIHGNGINSGVTVYGDAPYNESSDPGVDALVVDSTSSGSVTHFSGGGDGDTAMVAPNQAGVVCAFTPTAVRVLAF